MVYAHVVNLSDYWDLIEWLAPKFTHLYTDYDAINDNDLDLWCSMCRQARLKAEREYIIPHPRNALLSDYKLPGRL